MLDIAANSVGLRLGTSLPKLSEAGTVANSNPLGAIDVDQCVILILLSYGPRARQEMTSLSRNISHSEFWG